MDILINKNETICLTGHRQKSFPWGYDESRESCLRFKEEVWDVFVGAIEFGTTTFWRVWRKALIWLVQRFCLN